MDAVWIADRHGAVDASPAFVALTTLAVVL